MKQLGYFYHCIDDGRSCYHRRLNDPQFPRFHAYTSEQDGSLEIDVHFDALDEIHHRGNHDRSWAYEGGRLVQEMARINDVLEKLSSKSF